MLKDQAAILREGLDRARAGTAPRLETGEIGIVRSLGSGVARVTGFTTLRTGELLGFPDGLMGMAESLSETSAGIVLLGAAGALSEGDRVHRTGRIADMP